MHIVENLRKLKFELMSDEWYFGNRLENVIFGQWFMLFTNPMVPNGLYLN